MAAIASMAAGEQGKFWEYHDVLFKNNKALKKPQLIGYAKELGLDMKKFKVALRDPKIHLKVDNDTKATKAVGGPYKKGGTPSFYVNGIAMAGRNFPDFQKVIADQLKKAKKLEEEGTARADIAKVLTEKEENGSFVARYFMEEIALMTEAPGLKPYKVPVDPNRNASLGDAGSPLTLVHYTDLTNPKSKDAHKVAQDLMKAFPGKIRLVNKAYHRPDEDAAFLVSEAALAAKAQGKYWEMHAKLYENQGSHARADLDRYGAEVGLDMAKFGEALDKRRYKGDIFRDIREAMGAEVGGLPTFFINGSRIDGADVDDLTWTATEELKKAEKLLKGGTKADELYGKLIKGGNYISPVSGRANTFNLKGAASMGSPGATITIVEFSDFQCPYCSTVGAPLKKLVKKYPNQLRVVFKHFPLSFHKQAKMCAQASLAANAQGKFWEMHDKIFTLIKESRGKKPDEKAVLYTEKVQTFATELGLDMVQFNADLSGAKFKVQVEADMAEGPSAGVRGTPSIFVNGQKWDTGKAPPDMFEPYLIADFGLQVR